MASILKVLIGAAPFLAASADCAAQAASCRAMLNGAPEHVLRLEAVRTCRGADAACAYTTPAPGRGVLTLICPASRDRHVLGAERLESLRFRNGTLAGECSAGSWRRDAGLPGCYP